MKEFVVGLEITAVGLAIVFLALIIVALITSLLSIIVNRLEKGTALVRGKVEAPVVEGPSEEEIAPAIIAVISAVLGRTMRDIKEIRIRPVNPD